jgi:3-phenylpropionate/trans-cinnamate dioxygenase ferredoxin reductase subunit
MNAPRHIVIVGGGQAGGWVARSLRDQGHDGAITLIGDEPHPPYERPPLSKALLLGTATPESTHIFPGDAWTRLGVVHRAGARATAIDRDRARVTLADGDEVPYEALVLATGAAPRKLPVPGADLPGVHVLRSLQHSAAIAEDFSSSGARGGTLLVVGGGWIGLEVAAAARQRGLAVVLVEALPQLCGRALVPDLAATLADIHRAHGVDLRLGASVRRFDGTTRVERATLGDGTTLAIDAAVVGIGVVPETALAARAGLAIDGGIGGIAVDEHGRTSDPAIFAAGDATSHPNPLLGRRIRLESWENAQNQGIHVGKAILGKAERPYAEIPWFWSDQYDLNIQLAGLPLGWDRAVRRGGDTSFVVGFFAAGTLAGVAAFNAGRDLKLLRRAMQNGVAVDPDRLADPGTRLADLLKPAR